MKPSEIYKTKKWTRHGNGSPDGTLYQVNACLIEAIGTAVTNLHERYKVYEALAAHLKLPGSTAYAIIDWNDMVCRDQAEAVAALEAIGQ